MCNYWLIGIAHVCNRVGAAMINLRRHPLLLRMPNRWWSCCCCISALCQLLTYTKEQLGLGMGVGSLLMPFSRPRPSTSFCTEQKNEIFTVTRICEARERERRGTAESSEFWRPLYAQRPAAYSGREREH
jgi:hypothetical protein